MATKAKQFRLGSNEMCHAPGILRWAIDGYRIKSQRRKIQNVMMAWPTVTRDIADRLLSGEIEYTIEGETIVFTA